jgi:hypothetical protein
MNVKLLRKVKRRILAEPKRLYMTSYLAFDRDVVDRPMPKCGTVGCIAGWACIIAMPKLSPQEIWRQFAVGFKAMELLGLTDEEKFRLFEPGAWPKQFERGTSDDGKKKTAEVAAARIEHFIKTKGKE